MKRFQFLKLFSWTATHTAWLTMAISPVAMGKQAENFKDVQLKQYIYELGLNRKTTAQEFWAKSSFYFPGYAYVDLQKAVLKNPQKLMPIFEVKTTKNTNGENVPTIFYTEEGKSYNIQFIGEKDKYLKINNTFLSEIEVENPKKVIQKIIQADKKLSADLQKQSALIDYKKQDLAKRPFQDFKGFPRLNKSVWTKMSLSQKAAYIVEMRLLNEKADLVRQAAANKKAKSKKTSQLDVAEKYQMFVQFLLGQEACAASTNFFNGQHCINQGFVASSSGAYRKNEEGRETCNLYEILKNDKYTKDPLIKKAVEDCVTQNQMPCNPLVYSFDSNGKAFCNGPTNTAQFQKGTAWDGGCDSKARLSKGFIDASSQKLRTQDQQRSDNKGNDIRNVDSDKIQELIKQDQAKESFAATKAYLEGMLKAEADMAKEGKDKEKANELLKLFKENKWSAALEFRLLDIQTAFEENIKNSMKLCSADLADTRQTHENNYRDACEQLHRRWLFTKDIIAAIKCKDETGGEEEPEGQKQKIVGQKDCAPLPVPAVVVPPEVPSCPTGSTEAKDGVNNDEHKGLCTCEAQGGAKTFMAGTPLPEECNKKPEPVATEGECKYKSVKGVDPKTCKCENGEDPKVRYTNQSGEAFSAEPAKEEYYCAGDVNWWLVGGILGGIGLLALLLKNKKKDTKCTNGGTPPDCIVDSKCPAGTTGTPPDKCFGAGKCPAGTTGTYPDCFGAGKCPAGTTGTYPNCYGAGQCPPGTTGTYPNCYGTPQCPIGTSGVFPNCRVTCSGNQVPQGTVCVCPNSCSGGATQNPVSCTCSAPPNEGGTGNNSCQNPPCSGGVPSNQ